MLNTIAIALIVIVSIINVLVAYACCVVAGEADEARENSLNEKREGD